MEKYIDRDGTVRFSPFGEKPKPRSKGNRPPDWNLIADLCLQVEDQHYECPICTMLIPGKKRNLRNHLRDDHTQAELVSYMVSWEDYYDAEAEIDVEFITGTHLRIFLPGKEITKKLRQFGHAPTHDNFIIVNNIMTANLASLLTDLLTDRTYDPIEEHMGI